MIAYEIYKGRDYKELEISKEAYDDRKKTLDKFLAQWDGNHFTESYYFWLKAEAAQEDIDYKPNEITVKEMALNLKDSVKDICRSGVKFVSNESHNRRYSICKSCKYLVNGRCKKCGCFMKLKTKFEAMHCPIGL